ncbi:MAG: hypothetical protein AMS17_16440 [Spirochaetes bacterium DG_61]|nr:MAG: hypothetical protein AMS17_16440 [Spirochaetes bacterium DG_61]
MGKFDTFQKISHRIPERSLAWRIYGKGMEHFGDSKGYTEIPVPEPGDDELLVRNDSVGLCFSDTKIIKFGNDHPRIQGRDLKNDPVIPGHEVSLTVIKVGKNRIKEYRPGQRFIIQADVFYKGKSSSYGYVLPGGLTQYGIIGKEVLDGDGGSYLIPLQREDVGYSEVALVEPWACVVAAYRIEHRDGIKDGGNLLVLGSGKPGKIWDFSRLFKGRTPKKIVLAKISEGVKEAIEKSITVSGPEVVFAGGKLSPELVRKLSTQHTGGEGFDDIILLGDIDRDILAAAGDCMCAYGILNYMAESGTPQITRIDAGKIHYDRISFLGSTGTDVSAPYSANRDYGIRGESVILFGAGGPMGQMHVQLIMEEKKAPKRLIVTDIADDRLEVLKDKFTPLAEKKGISYHVLNPVNFASPEEFRNEVLRINGGRLFDYVVCLAAIPAVIENAASYLGERSVLNIFAGVSKGTIANLNIKDVVTKSTRYIGSSGSSLDDMEFTLRKMEKGELDTNNAVAGVSGMNDVWNGIDAVRTGSFPGKIVVYPHIRDLNLLSLHELSKKYPKVGALLSENGSWTREAEAKLLDELLDIE